MHGESGLDQSSYGQRSVIVCAVIIWGHYRMVGRRVAESRVPQLQVPTRSSPPRPESALSAENSMERCSGWLDGWNVGGNRDR